MEDLARAREASTERLLLQPEDVKTRRRRRPNRVRERRLGLGFTRAELAKHAGVSGQVITNLELGAFVPRREVRELIAEKLECAAAELFELPECSRCGAELDGGNRGREYLCDDCVPIRRLRKTVRMTQAELADRIGVSAATITAIETGVAPAFPVAERLAGLFGVTTHAIFGHPNECSCGCGELAYAAYRRGHYIGVWNRVEGRDAKRSWWATRRSAGDRSGTNVRRGDVRACACRSCGRTRYVPPGLARRPRVYLSRECAALFRRYREHGAAIVAGLHRESSRDLQLDALSSLVKLGKALEENASARRLKTGRVGRRPLVCLDYVIEALFLRGFSDGDIHALIEVGLNARSLEIPGICGDRVNLRYVTRRREQAGIRRATRGVSV